MGGAHSFDVSDFDAEGQALEIHYCAVSEANLRNEQLGEYMCACLHLVYLVRFPIYYYVTEVSITLLVVFRLVHSD